jgi:hypothetical protein
MEWILGLVFLRNIALLPLDAEEEAFGPNSDVSGAKRSQSAGHCRTSSSGPFSEGPLLACNFLSLFKTR